MLQSTAIHGERKGTLLLNWTNFKNLLPTPSQWMFIFNIQLVFEYSLFGASIWELIIFEFNICYWTISDSWQTTGFCFCIQQYLTWNHIVIDNSHFLEGVQPFYYLGQVLVESWQLCNNDGIYQLSLLPGCQQSFGISKLNSSSKGLCNCLKLNSSSSWPTRINFRLF